MAVLTLASRLRAGENLVSGWITLPEPLIAELASRQPFDAVALDMQHGLQDMASVMRSISAIVLVGKPAMVRLAVNDMATASRILDFGAEAVIAPMINSAEEARALVAATKYPPVGERSWGPVRAMALQGIDTPAKQLATANRNVMTFAMIETDRALAALDDILSVEGLDGCFVGPSDLSVTFSSGEKITPTEDWLDEPISLIADKVNAAQKIAGIFAVNPARARHFRGMGYRLIALGSDQLYLADGIKAMLAGLK